MPGCNFPVTVFMIKPRVVLFTTVYDVFFTTLLPLQAGSRVVFSGALAGGHSVQQVQQNPQAGGNLYRIVKTALPPFPLNVILNQPAGQVRLSTCFGPFVAAGESGGFSSYYRYDFPS